MRKNLRRFSGAVYGALWAGRAWNGRLQEFAICCWTGELQQGTSALRPSEEVRPCRGADKYVYGLEAARRKPGNLAAAKRILTYGELRDIGLKAMPERWRPRIATSSSQKMSYDLPFAYFLQDGIIDEWPIVPYLTWSPVKSGKSPWVRVGFGENEGVFKDRAELPSQGPVAGIEDRRCPFSCSQDTSAPDAGLSALPTRCCT